MGHISKQRFSNQPELVKAMTYNNLRLVHVWLDEYKVKEMSVIWNDEQEHRMRIALKKPVTAFPDNKLFFFFLSFP